jgi:hypothetical protein
MSCYMLFSNENMEFVTPVSQNKHRCSQQSDTTFGTKATFDEFLHLYQGRRPVQKVQTRVYDLDFQSRNLQLAQRKRCGGVFIYRFRSVLPIIHEERLRC